MSTPEDIREDGKQQDREERASRRRERILAREPNIGEPCPVCQSDGKEFIERECRSCGGWGSA